MKLDYFNTQYMEINLKLVWKFKMPVWECLQERRQKKLSRMLRRYEKDFVKSLTIFLYAQ